MYSLHIANKNYSSWSLRPWVLLRALDIPFEEVMHPFAEDNREAFQQFSPTALVPCLVDSQQRVWDSLAIIEYLAESHSEVWPGDKAARAWARSASAEMHSGFNALRNDCSMSCGQRVKLNQTGPALEQNMARLDELWCEGISLFGGPFLAGKNFTAVDAFYAPVVFRIETYLLPLSGPAQDYQHHMFNLPVMREWYDAAIREPWREDAHEQDIAAAGTVIRDDRSA